QNSQMVTAIRRTLLTKGISVILRSGYLLCFLMNERSLSNSSSHLLVWCSSISFILKCVLSCPLICHRQSYHLGYVHHFHIILFVLVLHSICKHGCTKWAVGCNYSRTSPYCFLCSVKVYPGISGFFFFKHLGTTCS